MIDTIVSSNLDLANSQQRPMSNPRVTHCQANTQDHSSVKILNKETHSVFLGKKRPLINNMNVNAVDSQEQKSMIDNLQVKYQAVQHTLVPKVTDLTTAAAAHRHVTRKQLHQQTSLQNQKSCDHLRIKRAGSNCHIVPNVINKSLIDLKNNAVTIQNSQGNLTTTAAKAVCVSSTIYAPESTDYDENFTNVVRNKKIDASKHAFNNCLNKSSVQQRSITALNDITGIIFNNLKSHQKALVNQKRFASKRCSEKESVEPIAFKEPSSKINRVRSNGKCKSDFCDTKNSNSLITDQKHKVTRISSNGVINKQKKLVSERENDVRYFLNNKNINSLQSQKQTAMNQVPAFRQPQSKNFRHHNFSSSSGGQLSTSNIVDGCHQRLTKQKRPSAKIQHSFKHKQLFSRDYNENVQTNECKENRAYKVNQLQLQRLQQRLTKDKQLSRSEDSDQLLSEPSSKATSSTTYQSTRTTEKTTTSPIVDKCSNSELLRQFKSKLQTASRNQAEQEQIDMQKFLVQKEASTHRLETMLQSPLMDHNVTKDYRTKMVDWMVEVMTSFKCSRRAYFLAVKIFDEYLTKMQGILALENQEIHGVGVTAMYMASKYEDIYPLHSRIVADKIAHGALSQREVLQSEEAYLRLFGFQLDFVTPLEFHQTFSCILQRRISFNIDKICELSMLLIKMALQNLNFCKYQYSLIVLASFHAAIKLLVDNKWYNQSAMDEVRQKVIALLKENRDFGGLTVAQGELENVSRQLSEFYGIFDQWHCGLNQLRSFANLSFKLN